MERRATKDVKYLLTTNVGTRYPVVVNEALPSILVTDKKILNLGNYCFSKMCEGDVLISQTCKTANVVSIRMKSTN